MYNSTYSFKQRDFLQLQRFLCDISGDIFVSWAWDINAGLVKSIEFDFNLVVETGAVETETDANVVNDDGIADDNDNDDDSEDEEICDFGSIWGNLFLFISKYLWSSKFCFARGECNSIASRRLFDIEEFARSSFFLFVPRVIEFWFDLIISSFPNVKRGVPPSKLLS